MLTVFALGPVTHSYLLIGDFDGRSSWRQGCTAPQGILEPNHAVTCKPVCTTCTLLVPAHAANEVWLEDLGQILQRVAAGEHLHSTHIAVGKFVMLVWMQADHCKSIRLVINECTSVEAELKSSTTGSGSSSSSIQLRCTSQVWVHRQVSHRDS